MDRIAPCKLLIFEDDSATRAMLADFFTSHGATVATAEDGRDALTRIQCERPDLLILDVVMPYQNGLAILEQLRAEGSTVPVLMLTAKDTVDDKVTGLELGADDYLAKPFAAQELLARARVLLRRTRQAVQMREGCMLPRQVGCLGIDPQQRVVTVHGQNTLPLTKTEFDLLFDLAEHAGGIRSYAQLMQEVLGYDPGVESRALSMHIANIRRKFEDAGATDSVRIRTVTGIGYALAVKEEA